MKSQTLVVDRKDYKVCKIVEEDLHELQDGEVLMKIERFSLTTNNITYAVVGDMIGYWNFFKAEEGHGIIPVWGFADVITSKHDSVQVGEKFYGYYPMGSHLKVTPTKISPLGFIDGAEHRSQLPVIYNYYTNSKADSIYTKESENVQCLLRPLFTTSFLIDDFFAKNNFFGSENIILTSASSKTAMSLAHLLHQRKVNGNSSINVIGLTSAGNMDFVKASGYYDEVLEYADVEKISNAKSASIVEFAGNHKLQYQMQVHLGDALKYNCLVGVVHKDELRGAEKLPKKGDFFFAPTYAQQRQKELGREEFQKLLHVAWNGVISKAAGWMNVVEHRGAEELKSTYLDLLAGNINPKEGHIISV